ncbi:MAG: MFS transporter [Lachnospiraceae bacterium]|nr:MFS transporter [Lachnospiraceae bacterium]
MTENKTRNNKIHYAWYILILVCVLNATTMGFLVNCNGVYYQPIIKEMGWELSQYTFMMIFIGLAAFFTLPFVDKIFARYPIKLVLTVTLIGYAVCFALKGAMYSLLGFGILFVFTGIFSAFLLYVPGPMLINAWFAKKRGMALGIAMMSMGIGGAVMNPILGAVIESAGWRTATYIQGGLSILIAVPCILLIARKTPEEIGLKPYGAEELEAERRKAIEDAMAGKVPANDAGSQVFDRHKISKKEKSIRFTMCFVLAILANLMSAIPQQLPSYATTCGFASMIGATLVSVNMIGNTTVKAIMGVCVDKFGERKVYTVTMLLILAGLVFAIIGGQNIIFLYIAAAILGLTAADNVMLPPMSVRTFADGTEYAHYMSRVSMGTMFATAIGTFLISWLYDVSGSYINVFLIYGVIQIAALILMLFIFSKRIDNERK